VFRRSAGEQAVRLLETLPHLQRLFQQKSEKIAIKANGRILLVDPDDVVSVHVEGNYVLLQSPCPLTPLTRFDFFHRPEAETIRILADSPVRPGQCLICGRARAAALGRVHTSDQGWQGIHSDADI
jgi:hypothetical protein